MKFSPILLTLNLIAGIAAYGAEDRVLADFDGEDYGAWRVAGDAFGMGPVEKHLLRQGPVLGIAGKGFANSFHGQDKSTGTLSSPDFVVEHDYLAFLIGGGVHEQTALQVVIDGDVVARQSGFNHESLEQHAIDLRPFKGKSAQIRLVDQVEGSWGHVNVDAIVLTDVRPTVLDLRPREREEIAASRYLIVPVCKDIGVRRPTLLRVFADGEAIRHYSVDLATSAEDVGWYAYLTIGAYAGKTLRVSADPATDDGFSLIRQSDTIPGEETFYTEAHRPQFHFTQKVGWNNDPNGMVYHDPTPDDGIDNGTWHFFFQHNPVGLPWGNMTWGHATSTDLLHWEQQPNKLFPVTMAKGACFSGGATVDKQNTAGWGKNALVAFLTDTGAGESIAYSTDNGETFTYYAGNPVIAKGPTPGKPHHVGRDPKVIWYAYDDADTPLNARTAELGGHWVMVVYDQTHPHGQNAAFYTSADLKDWTEQSHLPGYYECTELFELPVDGDAANSRWVVFAADAKYAIGQFDGRTFTPEHEGKHQVHYGPYYASQTFDNAPDGRRIQMGWLRVGAPGAPYNQHFSFPHELTLWTTADGIRMRVNPVKEIDELRTTSTSRAADLQANVSLEIPVATDLLDIRATVAIGNAKKIVFEVPGRTVVYDVAKQNLYGAPLKPVDGTITVRLLCDRALLEVIGNDGEVFISGGKAFDKRPANISVISQGGDAKLLSLDVHELKSIWRDREKK